MRANMSCMSCRPRRSGPTADHRPQLRFQAGALSETRRVPGDAARLVLPSVPSALGARGYLQFFSASSSLPGGVATSDMAVVIPGIAR